jgi:hypothetical protein
LALRARIVLASAERLNNAQIAERLAVDHATVRIWRNRFATDRPDGLVDERRPGVDNASTHKTPAIKRWLLTHPRFELHFTPTSSSWLNLVERWFSELTTNKLRRGTHRSVHQLNNDIRDWIDTWNQNPQPFAWTKTAEQTLDSIATYCDRINESRH